jgi:hypothetical protein
MRTRASPAAATLLATSVLSGLSLGPSAGISARNFEAGAKDSDTRAGAAFQVTIYDSDPQHLWNRLHRALWVRAGPDGKEYGHDRLDPLLWFDSKHLVEGKSHELAIAVLDEFLAQRGDKLVNDPLKKAILQRDLWAVFDWTAEPGANTAEAHLRRAPPQRRALQLRLARAIQRLALSSDQIKTLPDNYAAAAASQAFAAKHDPAHPERPFLPTDLFQKDGPWVEVEIDNGSAVTASRHAYDFGARSCFRVFLGLPQGRKATLAYFDTLRIFPRPWVAAREPDPKYDALVLNPELPQFPVGTQTALVRQMLLVDKDGRIATTRVTETVQIRIFRAIPKLMKRERQRDMSVHQEVYEFTRTRALLFAHERGGLRPLGPADKDFRTQLLVHPFDEFELPPDDAPFERRIGPTNLSCLGCHDSPGIFSVQSYVGGDFPRPRYYLPVLQENKNADSQGELSAMLKRQQYSWGLLQGLWKEQPSN